MILVLLRWLGRLVLRIFFRRVAVVGGERFPMDGPIILVANHPNALVDPLFFLALVPRRLAFLAKEPLFHIPIVGWIVRAAGSVPVYRHQDPGADVSKNRSTFAQVYKVLHRGGAVALFPEGVSHNDPVQRPFKTGAARLAIGAASTVTGGLPVRIVPIGLYYTAKTTFRSSAVLCYGTPLVVPPSDLDATGEPLHDDVHALTAKIEYAIAEVTLQADQHEALDLIGRAERVFSSASGALRRDGELIDQFALRRRFLGGYTLMREQYPARLAQVTRLIEQYEAELAHANIAPESLVASSLSKPRLAWYLLKTAVPMIFLAPFAMIGIVVHFIAYRVTGPLSNSMSRGSLDMIATVKILASGALYPLSWLIFAAIVTWQLNWQWGLVMLIGAPISGWIAMIFLERLAYSMGEWRALGMMMMRPGAFRHIMAERRQIRETILALDRELPLPR